MPQRRSPKVVSPDEPGTYTGGYLKGIKEYLIGSPEERQQALSGENPLLKAAANPQSIGDLLSLVMPSELPRGLGAAERASAPVPSQGGTRNLLNPVKEGGYPIPNYNTEPGGPELLKRLQEKGGLDWEQMYNEAHPDTKSAIAYMLVNHPEEMQKILYFNDEARLAQRGPWGLGGKVLGQQTPGGLSGGLTHFSQVELDPKHIADLGKKPIETLAHEVQHATDQHRLGGMFNRLYEQQTNKVGYLDNPYEVSARQAGKVARRKFYFEDPLPPKKK